MIAPSSRPHTVSRSIGAGLAGALVTTAVTWLLLRVLDDAGGADALVASMLSGDPGAVLTTAASASGAPVEWSALGAHGVLWPVRFLWQGTPLTWLLVAPLAGAAAVGWSAARLARRAGTAWHRPLAAASLGYGGAMACLAVLGGVVSEDRLTEVRTPPLAVLGLAVCWAMLVGAAVTRTMAAVASRPGRVARARVLLTVLAVLTPQTLFAVPAHAEPKPTPGAVMKAPIGYKRPGVAKALDGLRAEAAGDAVLVASEPWRGTPSMVSMRSRARDVPSWLDAHSGLFGVDKPSATLRALRRDTDPLGQRHDWFEQVVGGVPVYGARVGVHRDAAGTTVHALTNGLLPGLVPDGTVATLGRDDAVAIARFAMPGAALVGEPKMYLLPDGPVPDQPTKATLAWRVQLAATTGAHTGVAYWVAARSRGSIVFIEPTSQPMMVRAIYDFHYGPDAPSTPARFEGDGPTGIADVDLAYTFAGWFYGFYHDTFGRDSYDGQGAPLPMAVNVRQKSDEPFLNAMEDDGATYFGENMVTLDIVGHEWTHAVTAWTAGLMYMYQSGALNESFSDAMGEAIRYYATGYTDFRIGAGSAIGEIRDMADPARHGDPDNARDFVTGCADSGYVHTNSGIPNKAFYVLASRIGVTNAARIWYRDLTVYLGPRARFTDARNGAIQAAYDLFGKRSAEATEVARAWGSVGVDGIYETPRQDCPCFADAAVGSAGTQGMDPAGATPEQVIATLARIRGVFETATTPGIAHFAGLYAQANTPALALVSADPDLRRRTAHLLQTMEPALRAVNTTNGDVIRVSRALITELMDLVQAFIDADRAHGTGELAILLERERQRAHPDNLVGLTVNQVRDVLDTWYH
jgi:Zn-dependent metalloprotease